MPPDSHLSRLFISTSWSDIPRRSAIRIIYCALPYLGIAWWWSLSGDSTLLRGFWIWWCVAIVPVTGLALDLWRLKQTRRASMTLS
jgi:hypothetical protein